VLPEARSGLDVVDASSLLSSTALSGSSGSLQSPISCNGESSMTGISLFGVGTTFRVYGSAEMDGAVPGGVKNTD